MGKEKRMAPKDLDKLIEKYLAGNCTQEERDLIDGWYSSLGGETSAQAGEPEDKKVLATENRIVTNIQRHTHAPTPGLQETSRRMPFLPYISIAASLVFLLGAGYYFMKPRVVDDLVAIQSTTNEFTNVSNATEALRRVILPDGSIVMMSPQSKLRFLKETNTPSREIFLEGEAYFDVAHDPSRPFYVYAGNVITKVLGTSFIVRNQKGGDKVTVSVKTGKVTVYSRKTSHKKTVLTPNQEAVYDHTTDLMATQIVSQERVMEERKAFNDMHFEETPITEVLSALMKTYDINIVFQEEMLSGCVLTSSFYEEGLYDRIDVICTAIGATYRIVDTQIVIESNGCNLKPA
jgi:transmembrane sensor